MLQFILNVVEEAFDTEALKVALQYEIEARISYEDIAENICDYYADEIAEAAAEYARSLRPV